MDVALITGCASGIGRALAEDLNERYDSAGAKLYKVYASDYRLEMLKDLEPAGIETIHLDVTNGGSIKAAVDTILGSEGRIDLLVCNAGMGAAGWMTEVPIENMEHIFNINVFGTFRTIQAVSPSMMDMRKGKIVTFSSVLSYVANAFGGAYGGSKAALAMMTEALRIELEPFNISVTSVIPGNVKSQIMANALVPFERYESPDSQYHRLMPRLRQSRARMAKRGLTPKQAAHDIAEGLTKSKPKRFLYTGTWLFYILLGGLLQTWICPGIVAKRIQKNIALNQLDKLGRAKISPPTHKAAC